MDRKTDTPQRKPSAAKTHPKPNAKYKNSGASETLPTTSEEELLQSQEDVDQEIASATAAADKEATRQLTLLVPTLKTAPPAQTTRTEGRGKKDTPPPKRPDWQKSYPEYDWQRGALCELCDSKNKTIATHACKICRTAPLCSWCFKTYSCWSCAHKSKHYDWTIDPPIRRTKN